MAGWRELSAPGRDGPGFRVVVPQHDGRHANDPAILHIDEDRTAVVVVDVADLAAGTIQAVPFSDGRRTYEQSLEPGGVIRPAVHGQPEHFLGMDLFGPVEGRDQQIPGRAPVAESQGHIGSLVDPFREPDLPSPELEPVSGFFLVDHDLGHEVAFGHLPRELRESRSRDDQVLVKAEHDHVEGDELRS